eukprot:scaffold78902_cov48-Attheya_sp.AAC.1
MLDKPRKLMNDYRYVVRGSPYYKEHRNAPPEPVGSNLLQNKKDKAIGCTTGIVVECNSHTAI